MYLHPQKRVQLDLYQVRVRVTLACLQTGFLLNLCDQNHASAKVEVLQIREIHPVSAENGGEMSQPLWQSSQGITRKQSENKTQKTNSLAVVYQQTAPNHSS